MNDKVKNAWVWVKDHKTEIAITSMIAVCGVILHKTNEHANQVKNFLSGLGTGTKTFKYLDISDIGIGTVDTVVRHKDGMIELWMDNVPLTDMGKLGEAISEKIPDLPANPIARILLTIKPGEETVG